jgi:hypothetical protein
LIFPERHRMLFMLPCAPAVDRRPGPVLPGRGVIMSKRRAPKRGGKDVTRREFLRRSVELGAAATAGALAPAAFAQGSPDEFEYIVVGSGAGGGPVAANLARAGFRVLLLEAGGGEEASTYGVPCFHGLSTEDPG